MATGIPPKSFAVRAAFRPLWTALGLSLLLALAGFAQGIPQEAFFGEGGPVENASVAALLCGALGFVLLRPDAALGRGWQVTAIMLLLAARELDFDKRFMDKGVLQLRLYTGDFPLWQKLIGAFFVLLILYTLYRLVRHGLRPLLSGLRDALWARATVLAIVTGATAKSIDGAERKLAPLGIELNAETLFRLALAEETGELAFALLLVLAICDWMRRSAVAVR